MNVPVTAGETPALALEDIAALSAKFQSKYEALEPKRASDEQLLRRAATSGQSPLKFF